MSKIGFTCGAMDLLHAGHILMLKDCRSQCDHLIVGLHTNPQLDRPDKNKPIQSLIERYIQLEGCSYVDQIIPYETEADLVELLTAIPIDIRFVGDDWRDKPFTGHEITKIQVSYNTREHDYSSSGLRRRIADSVNK